MHNTEIEDKNTTKIWRIPLQRAGLAYRCNLFVLYTKTRWIHIPWPHAQAGQLQKFGESPNIACEFVFADIPACVLDIVGCRWVRSERKSPQNAPLLWLKLPNQVQAIACSFSPIIPPKRTALLFLSECQERQNLLFC